MGTIEDKLNRLINTKEGIRQEINRAYNTEEISNSDTFNRYVQKLEEHPFYVKRLIDGTIKNIKISNITSIGTFAFNSCNDLTSVSFPNTTRIGYGAFYKCSSLNSVSFPNATSIDDWTFSYCSNLTSASFPKVISIGYSAFYSCRSLTDVDIPKVTSIGNEAFSYCSSLTSTSFPNATSIGEKAFYNCNNLTTIYVGTNTSTVCTLGSLAFYSCTSLTNIYVPFSLVDSYKSATNWSSFASKIQPYEQPVECITLSITADDVSGRNTTTTVYYTAECTYSIKGVIQDGTKVFTGKATSNSFEQNTSTTNTVQRIVSFTFFGKTATTTITQGVWINKYISVTTSGISDYGWVNANSQYNVDGYDVYMSDNVGIDDSCAVMKLECIGYTDLTLYIGSNAETNCDYTIASNANASTYPTSSDSEYAYMSTIDNPTDFWDPSDINNYLPIDYPELIDNDTIYIVFTKDVSVSEGDDRGYVLIPKQ